MNAPEVDPPLPQTSPADVSEGDAKPKRRRAPRKTAAEADAGAVPVAPAPSWEAVFSRNDAAPAEPQAASPQPVPVRDEAPPAAAVIAEGAEGQATPGPEATAAGEEGQGPGGRRGRNRRRGRRGGEKARTEDGTGAPVDAAPAVPAAQAGEVFLQVLSGEFEVEPAVEPAVEPEAGVALAVTETEAPAETESAAAEQNKRVLAPEADAPKLHKVLAQAGVGSRRDLETMIT